MNENKIEVFNSTEFGAVRTMETEDGKIMFCGADVAKALGYTDTAKAIKAHCKENGWVICPVIDSMGRTQKAVAVSRYKV